MSDIPPKQPVSGTAAARVESGYELPPIPPASRPMGGEYAPGAEPGALVSIHAAALQAGSDSFPVLKAFQDYLETERQRARRRLVMLSSFFVALMAVVVAGLLLAGVYLFRNMQRTQDVLLQAALQGAPAAAPLVAPAVVAPPPPAPAMPAALGDELQRLRAALADLRSDNEKLRTRLTAPSAAPTALPAPTAVAAAPAPAVTPASPPPPAAPSVASPRKEPLPTAVAAVRPQPPDGFADGTLHLPAGADEDPLPWRLFVPLR